MNSSGQVDGVMVTTSEACLAQVEKKNNQCKARSKPFAVIGVRQREKKLRGGGKLDVKVE